MRPLDEQEREAAHGITRRTLLGGTVLGAAVLLTGLPAQAAPVDLACGGPGEGSPLEAVQPYPHAHAVTR